MLSRLSQPAKRPNGIEPVIRRLQTHDQVVGLRWGRKVIDAPNDAVTAVRLGLSQIRRVGVKYCDGGDLQDAGECPRHQPYPTAHIEQTCEWVRVALPDCVCVCSCPADGRTSRPPIVVRLSTKGGRERAIRPLVKPHVALSGHARIQIGQPARTGAARLAVGTDGVEAAVGRGQHRAERGEDRQARGVDRTLVATAVFLVCAHHDLGPLQAGGGGDVAQPGDPAQLPLQGLGGGFQRRGVVAGEDEGHLLPHPARPQAEAGAGHLQQRLPHLVLDGGLVRPPIPGRQHQGHCSLAHFTRLGLAAARGLVIAWLRTISTIESAAIARELPAIRLG